MNREDAIATLRKHRAALQSRGVRRAALFGSTARGTAGPESDIDIMIELDPSVPMDVFEYTGLTQYITGLFEGQVDVVNREGLKPHLRKSAVEGAIYAF